MHGEKGINGLAAELWEGFAEQQHICFRYQEYPTVSALLDAVHRGEVDVAVSNITLTEERASPSRGMTPVCVLWFPVERPVLRGAPSGPI
ncbi:transporter substrate-binding domain-containing protein [Salmonella enterica subsp. salamae]|nr:hypothetical protein [Salmonella enterica]ECI5144679.1 hypothetical protein [Salmonella enterica subsp. salamae]ECP4590296.1 transporter substrate-binding domain-containing protein [Salmonella enterica subsp. enterica serovar Muenchen]EDV4562100.1 transporter substrate-binding domain-containing protein [Salmonella enterica subsp. enterica]HAE4726052.1 transporter substrate-binding domain-containing protein [Salmonella enterica subsp. salamae serovar 47:a:1,5]